MDDLVEGSKTGAFGELSWSGGGISLGGGPLGRYIHGHMTRPAIERCIWVFIVALIATFVWTVGKVLGMLGWF